MYKIICIGLKNEFFLTSIVLTSNSRHYERAWMAVGCTFGWFHWQIDVALVERLSGWRKVSNTRPSQTAFSNANPPSEVVLGPARLHWCGIPWSAEHQLWCSVWNPRGQESEPANFSQIYSPSHKSIVCFSYIETTCPKILCFIQDNPSPLLWQEMM